MMVYATLRRTLRTMMLIATFTAFRGWSYLAAQDIHVTGVEHIGMNVPDAAQAVKFFHDTFGFVPVTELGPYTMGNEFRKKYRVHPSAALPHVIMLRAGDGPNLEIFQFDSVEGSKQQPYFDDLGATHIAFYTDDIDASAAALRGKGIEVLTDPIVNTSGPTSGETWFYFKTPWGSSIELVSYPHGEGYEKLQGAIPLWNPHHVGDESASLDTDPEKKRLQEIATRYLEIFNMTDGPKRLSAIKELYSEDSRIVEKHSVLVGQTALSNYIADLQHRHPGSVFEQAGNIDAEGGSARIHWNFGPKGSAHPVVGQGVILFKNGKITETVLF